MRRIWLRGLRLGELGFLWWKGMCWDGCVFVKVPGSCGWITSESKLAEEVEVGFKET